MEKRILTMSDIHGEADKFNQLLNVVNYNPENDILVICGDLCDRGPKIVETIMKAKELKEKGAIVLKGNHDEYAQGTLEELIEGKHLGWNTRIHLQCDGQNTYDEFRQLDRNTLIDIYEFIADMPLAYLKDNYIFTHAGVNVDIPIEKNTSEDLLWIREEFFERQAYPDKTVIFGHTPTYYMRPLKERMEYKNKINEMQLSIWHDTKYNDKIGIDCGAVYGGRLACLELPTKKEYYV